MASGCASEKYSTDGKFDPIHVSNGSEHFPPESLQPPLDLVRGDDTIAGLDVESFQAIPEVPALLDTEVSNLFNGNLIDFDKRDFQAMRHALELAYIQNKSCVNLSFNSHDEVEFDDSKLLLYLEDSNGRLFRLSVANSANANKHDFIYGFTSAPTGADSNVRRSGQKSLFHDHSKSSSYMTSQKSSSGTYCTLNKIDFSKPFNLYLSTIQIEKTEGPTRVSWYPLDGHLLDTPHDKIVSEIPQEILSNKSYRPDLNQLPDLALGNLLVLLKKGDFKGVLANIKFSVADETLVDRINLGLVATTEAKKGRACNSEFISAITTKGGLLTNINFVKNDDYEIDRCPALSLMRFNQLPNQRPTVFSAVHNDLVGSIARRIKYIILPMDPGEKDWIRAMMSAEVPMLSGLKQHCQEAQIAPTSQTKYCALYAKSTNELMTLKAALKKEDFRDESSKSIRENVAFLKKLLNETF